jgi:hypothetical protein
LIQPSLIAAPIRIDVTDLATEKDVQRSSAVRPSAYFSSTTWPSLTAMRPVMRLSSIKASIVELLPPNVIFGSICDAASGSSLTLSPFLIVETA